VGLDDSTLLRVASLAYDAAEERAPWEEVLALLSDVLRTSGALLMYHDLSGKGGVAAQVRVDPESVQQYNAHYHQHDPWATSPRSLALAVPGRAVHEEQILAHSEFRKTAFFSDFSNRYQVSRLLTAALQRDDEGYSIVSAFRAESDEPFEELEVRFLAAVLPHVQRALRIQAKLRTAAQTCQAAFDGLDAVPHAVFLVDADANVRFSNQRGRDLLESGDGLAIDHGRLIAERPAETSRLRNACAALRWTQGTVPRSSGDAFALPRRLAAQPLQLMVSPTHNPLAVEGGVVALILVTDPQDRPLLREELLRLFYDLTPAEAKVASLFAAGDGIEEVCATLRYTKQTAWWYSKQVLVKTACRSRSELAGKLAHTLAAFAPRTSLGASSGSDGPKAPAGRRRPSGLRGDGA